MNYQYFENCFNDFKEVYKDGEKTLNLSFNKHKINVPSTCGFSAIYVANCYFDQYKVRDEIGFLCYYDAFLKETLDKTLFQFLNERLFHWKQKDKNLKDKDFILLGYLYKAFFKSTFQGRIIEGECIKFIESKYKIRKATAEEDVNLAIDAIINEGDELEFAIQIKPISFRYSLKSTSKNSLKKIKTSSNYNNLAIFIVYKKNNNWIVIFRDKVTKKLKDINLEVFLNNLSLINKDKKHTLKQISDEAFFAMEN